MTRKEWYIKNREKILKNKKKKGKRIIATYDDGRKIVFDSQKACAEYFHIAPCNISTRLIGRIKNPELYYNGVATLRKEYE